MPAFFHVGNFYCVYDLSAINVTSMRHQFYVYASSMLRLCVTNVTMSMTCHLQYLSGAPFVELGDIAQPWSVAGPESLGKDSKPFTTFSAVCWYFGKNTFDKLNASGAPRPIGLVSSNWGGE